MWHFVMPNKSFLAFLANCLAVKMSGIFDTFYLAWQLIFEQVSAMYYQTQCDCELVPSIHRKFRDLQKCRVYRDLCRF